MTVFETLMLITGIVIGISFSAIAFYLPIKRLRRRIWKLKGQVYYWSRQMPVNQPKPKRGRPRKQSV